MGTRRSVMVSIVAVLVVAGCTLALPSPSPQPPGASATGVPAPTAPPVTPTSTPTPTPVPTPTATFVDPEVGVVAVQVNIGSDLGSPGPTLTVYEDGRVLRLVEGTGQLGVRRLTRDGLEAIRRALLDSGFFEKDASFPFTPVPHGFMTYVATVRSGDRTVRVAATIFSVTPETEAFIALLERVVPLEAWLPDEAWLDLHPEPYQARHFWLTTDSSPGVLATYPQPPVFTADIDEIAPRLPLSIHEFGAPIPKAVQDRPHLRCGVVDAETARRILSVLALAGYEMPPPGFRRSEFEFGWRATNGIFWVTLESLLPDTPLSCEFAAGIG